MSEIRPYQFKDYIPIKANLEEAGFFDPVWDSEANVDAIAGSPYPLSSVLVAEEAGAVVGSVYTIPWGENVVFFYRLCVASSVQGRGIGSELLAATEERLRRAGAKELCAFFDQTNERLANFYNKRQFNCNPHHIFNCVWKSLDETT